MYCKYRSVIYRWWFHHKLLGKRSNFNWVNLSHDIVIQYPVIAACFIGRWDRGKKGDSNHTEQNPGPFGSSAPSGTSICIYIIFTP